MSGLQSEAPTLAMQHLVWFLGQPAIYISLVCYLSVVFIWLWAIRKVIFKKEKGLKYRFILVFYTIFLIVLVFHTYDRFQYFSKMLGA